MVTDMFLKIDGIKGESQDETHKDEIDILNWDFRVFNWDSFHQGRGGGAGKAEVYDIRLEKYVDAASDNMFRHIVTGKHIPEVKLTIRKVAGQPHEYLEFTFKKVVISGTATGASP